MVQGSSKPFGISLWGSWISIHNITVWLWTDVPLHISHWWGKVWRPQKGFIYQTGETNWVTNTGLIWGISMEQSGLIWHQIDQFFLIPDCSSHPQTFHHRSENALLIPSMLLLLTSSERPVIYNFRRSASPWLVVLDPFCSFVLKSSMKVLV